MDQSSFAPAGSNTTTGGDMGMTPLNRLIPQSSSASNGVTPSEAPPRMPTSQGMGVTAPMDAPMQTRDPMASETPENIVNDILKDVERSNPSTHEPPPQKPHIRFEEPPVHNYNEAGEDNASMMNAEIEEEDTEQDITVLDTQSSYKKEVLQNDFIGTILKEIRLPLIVTGLILFMGLSNTDHILGRLIPVLLMNGDTGYAGLIIKSIIGGLVFYAVLKIFT